MDCDSPRSVMSSCTSCVRARLKAMSIVDSMDASRFSRSREVEMRCSIYVAGGTSHFSRPREVERKKERKTEGQDGSVTVSRSRGVENSVASTVHPASARAQITKAAGAIQRPFRVVRVSTAGAVPATGAVHAPFLAHIRGSTTAWADIGRDLALCPRRPHGIHSLCLSLPLGCGL